MERKHDGKRILILGAAGMVGHKALQVFRSRFDDVYATVRKSRQHYIGHPIFASTPPERIIDGLDLLEPTRVLPVLDDLKPDVIFNCVGLTFRRDDSPSVEAHIRVNALLPHVLNGWCVKNQARMISLSTDCVFSGKTGDYTEESVTDARDAYGRSKALGEVESTHSLIIRTSVVGREIEHRTELLEWFLGQEGKAVKGFQKAVFSGVSTLFLSSLVADLIERFPNLHGIYQVATEPISKYDLLLKFREHFGLNVEITPDDGYSVRKNLIGTKFECETGIRVPNWDQLAREMSADPTPYFKS